MRVDLATQRAERAGHPLDLTAKEHALLVFFLRHPGEVLSRTADLRARLGRAYDGLSNTLEVHVMELRRKLEAHGPRLIHTLRGRGYLFGEPAAGPAGEGVMSLTTRLSLFFLAALAVVLAGLLGALYLLAGRYLYRQARRAAGDGPRHAGGGRRRRDRTGWSGSRRSGG